MSSERLVLCVRRDLADQHCGAGPWCDNAESILGRILDRSGWAWMPKASTEDSPGWRQVIPVLVLREQGTGRVLACRRLGQATEGRLSGLWTLSVGGHCELDLDSIPGGPPRVALLSCLRRELREELPNAPPFGVLDVRSMGLIHSHASAVDLAHLGWVWLGWVPRGTAIVPGPEFSESWWSMPATVRRADADGTVELEGWARILLDHLLDKRPVMVI